MNGANAHDQVGPRESAPTELVWEQINPWVWVSQCGGFKIERFIPGDHELLGTGFGWGERYRVLKRTPGWYFEHPSEPSLEAAKRACEMLGLNP